MATSHPGAFQYRFTTVHFASRKWGRMGGLLFIGPAIRLWVLPKGFLDHHSVCGTSCETLSNCRETVMTACESKYFGYRRGRIFGNPDGESASISCATSSMV